MNTEVVVGVLATVRAVLGFISEKEDEKDVALNILSSGNLAALGLKGEVLETALLGRAMLTYLQQRKISVEKAIDLIKRAEAEGRDVTSAEVQSELDITQAQLDATQSLIDEME
jgi:hypothetical protein